MEKGKVLLSLLIVSVIGILFLVHMNSNAYYVQAPLTIKAPPSNNKFNIVDASYSITPIKDSKHFMVSAYIDHRLDGVIRVISIINRNNLQPLYCVYCSAEQVCKTVNAEVQIHHDHFGFPYGATDVFCKGERTQNAAHVLITTDEKDTADHKVEYLPIKNKAVQETFKFNFTVCVSNLFGDYNNVLQFAQTIEMYKILGVQHVVVYKTACGPDLEKLLKHYETEGILEIVPWPIDQFLNPSSGWNIKKHKGDIQYYGQLVTLNECIYRHMYQSKYVLLNDIDEIIMPYKHANLAALMEDLQSAHPDIGVFLIENHIFPKTQFEESEKFKRAEWSNIPGVNIMEHIYREPSQKNVYNPTKMIVNPRKVQQTSVHSTLKNFGDSFRVPFNVCRIVHVRVPLQGHLTKEQLFVDKKVWDFERELIQNVDQTLKLCGFL
ncbi:glycosyltransferase family 92 protein [Puntigrus tetrazona]|uniref:glycosyltransferase family 92 protein n=1 Tax=Puntigrus tetrazona TaxID=1606681 RepID=UPI001C8AE543|nr:glycosyltransferase family 92 protein [Puntigrus tetrazona]XP_043103636.1 glycosyltransferase family 92 protein [Puntigrus tetrazona]